MDKSISLEVKLTSAGLRELLKGSTEVKNNLESAAKISNKIGPAPKAAATPSGTGETKTARSIGAGAGTGSAASDFAAQASGLGGLVHVYATFAANIFALSAAFTALSKAADVSNLVKGLDQLGAQSGRALGSLAKQMVAVTDGALSLQAAMSSTAMASAGGMTNQAILRMTEVARKASQALGRDMTDSMDRLTKGIIKIQPELLDELGIMTRVIPAQQAYARAVGKSVQSLTDFEKRQAFANAVLAEGEKKFSAISLASNPYSKISASLQNLLQTSLELVNKALNPILSILGSSPAALAGAIGLLGTMLLKQALPAIGMFRENAKKMADESYKSLVKRQKDQIDFAAETDQLAGEAALKAFKREESTQKTLEKIRFSSRTAGSKGIVDIVNKDPFALTDTEISKMQATANTLIDSKYKNWNEEAIRLQNHVDKIVDIRAKGEIAYQDAAEANEAKDMGRFAHQTQLQKVLDKETQAVSNRRILSLTAETAATLGPKRAWDDLNKSIANSKAGLATITIMDELGNATKKAVPATGALENGLTRIKGALGIATSAISTFMGAFGIWAAVIGIVVGALQTLYVWTSNSREANDRFSSSIEALNDSAKTAGNTLDAISNKGLGEAFTVESIQARANAMAGLSEAVKDAGANFKKLETLKNPFERIVDGIYSIFGKGDIQILYKGVAKDIKAAQALITDPKLSQDFQKAIDSAFGKPTSIDNLEEAFKRLNNQEKLDIIDKLAPSLKLVSDTANNAASRLTSFKDSLKTLGDQVSEYITKLLPTDDFTKFGISLFKIYTNISDSSLSAASSIEAMNDAISKDPNIGIFAPESTKALTQANLELKELYRQKEALEKQSAKANNNNKPLSESQIQARAAKGSTDFSGTDNVSKAAEAAKATTARSLEILKLDEKITYKRAFDSSNFLKELAAEIKKYQEAAKEFAASSNSIALRKNDMSIRASYGADISKDEKAIAQQEYALAKKDIDLKFLMYNSQKSNTDALIDLTDEFKIFTSKDGITTASGESVAKIKESKESRIAAKALTEGKDPIDQAKAIQLSNIGTKLAIDLKNAANTADKEAFALGNRIIDTENRRNAISKARLELSQLYNVNFSQGLSSQIQELDVKSANNKYAKELAAIQENINHLNKDKDAARIVEMESQKDLVKSQRDQEILAIRVSSFYSDSQKRSVETLKIEDRRLESLRLQKDLKDISSRVEQDALEISKEIGAITESEFIAKSAVLEKDKSIRNEAQAQLDIKRDTLAKIEEINNKQAAAELAKGGGKFRALLSTDESKQYDAERAKITENAALKSSVATAGAAADQASIETKKEINTLLADQNDQMKNMQSITESLTSLFGDMGGAIGKVGEALVKMAHNEEKLTKQKKAAGDDPKLKAKYEKDLAKTQLDGIIDVTSATKKMFNEKSAGYKVLDAAEKVSAALRMALMAQEMAQELATLPTKIAGGISAMFSQSGWGGFAGAAAFLALLSSFGAGGGGSAAVPQQSDYAGTGQSVGADGTVQDTNYGVIGDSTAQAKSITDAIEILSKQYFDFMGNTSTAPILKYLKGIQNNTAMLATSLSNSLNQSDGAGSLNGTSGGISGGISEVGGAALGFGFSAPLMGALGLTELGTAIGGPLGALGGFILGSIISSIGLGTEKWTQTGTGIKIGGKLDSIKSSAYQTYDVDVKDWLGRNSTNKETRNIDLGNDTQRYLKDTVTNFKNLILAIGTSLDDSSVAGKLSNSSLNVDVVKKSGETAKEFGDRISADFSKEFNRITSEIFPYISQFAKAGEEFGSTIVRLVKDQQDLTTGLAMINNPLTKLSSVVDNFTRNEKIVSNFGDMDSFVSSIQSYYDVMFTETERFDKKAASVASAMKTLGLESVTSVKQYRAVVESLDPSSELFATLIKLGPAFADVHKEAENLIKTLSAVELAAAKVDQAIKIMELLGNTEGVLAATRKKEYDALDDRLKPTQLYIYALQDEQKIRLKLTASINNIVTSLKNSINTLGNYNTALSSGTNSIFDPTEKYNLAKETVASLKSIISGPSITDADKAAQADAISKFPAASDAFLNASKTLYSSSEKYTRDFQDITTFIDNTSSILASQQTDAERQLTILQDSYSALGGIAEASQTTANLMSQYYIAWTSAMAAKTTSTTTDNIANTTLAANIPTNTPIITVTPPAVNTSTTQSNTALLEEIRLLKEEVAGLRADQAEQTGHIITTNYDANSKTATTIATATVNSGNRASWKLRSNVSIEP